MPLLRLFYYILLNKYQSHGIVLYADYAVLVIPKGAAHGVREIHTLISAVMILVQLAEWHMNIPQLLPSRSNILYFLLIYLSSWQRFMQS